MSLDERTLSIAVVVLAVVAAGLVAWVALLQRAEARLRRRLRRILSDTAGDGLDEVLDKTMKRLDSLSQRADALSSLHREVEALAQRSLHKVGVVRFNPFPDTGGDQSFAIALLDALGNGIILSSLHSRTDTRVFAKPVSGGRSRFALSEEEQDAIRKAMATAAPE